MLAPFRNVASQSESLNTTVSAISGANISIVQAALDFERSTWSNGPEDDSFYHVPTNSSQFSAGTLLKLEIYTKNLLYTVPPQTALLRILYQTKDFNGSLVPASAFIQWPYSARTQPDNTCQVVAWAHGTSGVYPACAPSHIPKPLVSVHRPMPPGRGEECIASDQLPGRLEIVLGVIRPKDTRKLERRSRKGGTTEVREIATYSDPHGSLQSLSAFSLSG